MAASTLAEADLHSLVDGHIEADRRGDLLRRLAGSPTDRALVEAWQDQADVIRAAFRDVAHEPLPVALDLAPPRLRSVEPGLLRPSPPIGATSTQVRPGGLAAMAAALLITIGLAVSWMAGSRDEDVADAAPPSATRPAAPAIAQIDAGGIGGGKAPVPNLPSLTIPDLAASGLTLTSVSSETGEPASIVLRYRDDGAGRVAVRVTRAAPEIGVMPVARTGPALTWRSRDAAFTLSGTLQPDKLSAIARTMRADQGTD